MGIIYQPNDTGNTAVAGWTCPYCNQLVGFGQPHACEVSDKPPTTEQLIAEIEWLRAEVERLRDQVLWLTEQNGELARKTRIYLDANRVLYQRVDRLERERNPQTETIRALRIAAESALSYFQAEWAEMDNHPASQYADYVEELARAIGK